MYYQYETLESGVVKKNQLVEVLWDDIIADSAWMSELKAAYYPATKCKTVGYFINKTKTVLRLSGTIQICDKPERDVVVIPVGVIKKIRRLK